MHSPPPSCFWRSCSMLFFLPLSVVFCCRVFHHPWHQGKGIVIQERNSASLAPLRLAPSLCISCSTKSDIHGIIMNPPRWVGKLLRDEIQSHPQILAKKSFSPYIIPKTKGLEESLDPSLPQWFKWRKPQGAILDILLRTASVKNLYI